MNSREGFRYEQFIKPRTVLQAANLSVILLTICYALTLSISQLPDVSPDPPGNRQNADDADYEVKAMKQGPERFVFVPLFAELLAHIGQTQAPWQRPGKRVQDKARPIHPRDARGKCNESADDGQQAAGENDQLAVTSKPTISKIEIVMGD